MVQVTGSLVDVTGTKIPGTVRVELYPRGVDFFVGGGGSISDISIDVSDGDWSLDLIPNSTISPIGSTYKVTLFGRHQVVTYISVPDIPGPHDINDLIADPLGEVEESAFASYLQRLESVEAIQWLNNQYVYSIKKLDSSPWPARPENINVIWWIGPDEPPWVDGDIWTRTPDP